MIITSTAGGFLVIKKKLKLLSSKWGKFFPPVSTHLSLLLILFLFYSAFINAIDDKELQELKDYTNKKPTPSMLDGMKFSSPLREISIIATDYGYFPSEFSVFEGERVKFFVTGASATPSCFILKDHGLFLGASRGKITEGETKFPRVGKFQFYCPTGKIEGNITVLKRQSEKERMIAAEKEKRRKQAWYPKDDE